MGGIACCTGGVGSGLGEEEASELAGRLAAVADPVRLRLLSLLADAPEGEVCVCDLAPPLGRSQPTVSHHLKVLADAGLVRGQKRGRWVWYRTDPRGLSELAGALGGLAPAASSTA